jgi:hypothetical protein
MAKKKTDPERKAELLAQQHDFTEELLCLQGQVEEVEGRLEEIAEELEELEGKEE